MDLVNAAANLPPMIAILMTLIVGGFGLLGTWVGYKSAVKNVDAMVEVKTKELMKTHEETFQAHLMDRINSMGTAIAECEERHNAERKKRLDLEEQLMALRETVYSLVRRLSQYEKHDLPVVK